MKYILKTLIIFLIKLVLIKLERLNPLSVCTKGRISIYDSKNEGICGFGSHHNSTNVSYLYAVASNEDFFNNFQQCGVCYEIVGPYGAIRVRVEDSCSKDDDLGLCSGDMYHFNVEKNGSSFLIGNGNLSNITFRMVSCVFSGNIKLKANYDLDDGWISFLVLEHNLAISSIMVNEDGSTSWKNLTREKNNYWTYYINEDIFFPLTIRIFSINNDYVSVIIDKFESEKLYEADGNFLIPNDTYFNISNFKKVNITSDKNKCCELDKSDFTPIYKDGQFNSGYNILNENVSVDIKSNLTYQNHSSINVNFLNYGKLIIIPIFPIRADQFTALSISIKSNKSCNKCLNISPYNLENKYQILSFENDNSWKLFYYNFSTLGIENNTFNGIIFNSNQNLEINIGNIELIENINAPDAGICFDTENNNSKGGIIPIIPKDNEKNNNFSNNTEIELSDIKLNETYIISNSLSVNGTIIDIEISNSDQIYLNNESTNMIDNSTNFETSDMNDISSDNEILNSSDLINDTESNIFNTSISDSNTFINETDSIAINNFSFGFESSIISDIESTDINNTDSSVVNDTESTFSSITDIIYSKSETEIIDQISENISKIINDNQVINIKSISSTNGYPEIINIKSNSFNVINNENMTLLFISKEINSSNFTTENCILPNTNVVSSFFCRIPFNISDGYYNIQSPSNNKYNVILKENILINNRYVSFEGKEEVEINQTINSSIIIINSIEQIINKGDIIIFQINPIEQEQYYLDNDQIIFVDETRTKALYLKNCQKNINNNSVNSISCFVSNNIIKANYTSLLYGQNISILFDKKINLIANISTGGLISETITRYISNNLTLEQKLFYNIIFNIYIIIQT